MRRKVYLRFGEIPTSGKSGIGAAFRRQHAVMGIRIPETERGVSVYEAFEGPPGVYEIEDARLESLDQLLAEACSGERTIYRVSGRRLADEGSDGEPLLRGVKVLGTVEPHQIRNAQVWPDGGEGMSCVPPELRVLIPVLQKLRSPQAVADRIQAAGLPAAVETGRVFVGYHRTGRITQHPNYRREDVPWLNGYSWVVIPYKGHRWVIDPQQPVWDIRSVGDVFVEDDEQHDYQPAPQALQTPQATQATQATSQLERLRSRPGMHPPLAGAACAPPDPVVTWAGFPWPACTPLYHATGAVPSILAQGFRTRAQGAPAAAGGSHTQSVSFTLIKKRAAAIALGLDVLARGMQGDLSLPDLITRLSRECPKGLARVLRKPWSIESFPSDMDLLEILARYEAGQARYYWYHAPESTWLEAWLPEEDPAPVGFSGRTPYTKEQAFFEVYTAVLKAGMWEGECFDPYFTGTSLGRLATLNRADIGVLECQIVPGMRVCGSAEELAPLGYLSPETARIADTGCENAVSGLARARQQAARDPAWADPPTPAQRALADEQAWAEERRQDRIQWPPRLPGWEADYHTGNQTPEESLAYSGNEQEIRLYDPSKVRIVRSLSLPVLRRAYRLGDRLTFPSFVPEQEVPRIWDPPTRSP